MMKLASTRILIYVLMSAAAPLFSGVALAQSAMQSAPAIREVPFQMLASGSQSGCVRPAKMIIGEEKEWRRVWRIHSKETAAPPIDFSRYRVVALLSGKGGAALDIVQVASTREQVTVFFHRGATTNRDAAPFRFALIEKTGSAARFIDQDGKVCAVCHVTQ